MSSLNELSSWLENEISAYPFPAEPANLFNPLRYFLTLGGKRMRPLLTIIAAQLSGSSKEDALPAALAVEFFHNFSLIHDDIMDKAPLRRGKKTVHCKWDENIAILSGDVLFNEAFALLCRYKDDRLPQLLGVFTQTANEVCRGQQLDMDFESTALVSKEEYVEMIRLKTSVLVGAALEMGAIVGHALPGDRSALYNFGVELGIAFQVQDDLLDLYGNPDTFGKQIGGDILSNKKTFLLLSGLENDGFSGQINDLLKVANPEEKVAIARQLLEESGARKKTENAIAEHYHIALQSLAGFSSDTTVLEELARGLIGRAD